jgi:phosphate transport system permease protein
MPPAVPASEAPRPRTVVARRLPQDRVYRGVASATAIGAFVLLFLIGVFLLVKSLPAFQHESLWTFLTTTGFITNGAHPRFGVASALYWTVIIALIAGVVGIPVSMAMALFITEYAKPRLKRILVTLVDLLAVVPSVVFGLWGLFVLQPNVIGVSSFLSRHFGWFPLFKVSSATFTSSAFIAGLVVGIMIVPIITSITREIFSLTPLGEREGALALGATKAGVIRAVVLPFGRGGLIGATMLGMGRALGETIAVAIIISLTFQVSPHILQVGANSISALIALRFSTGGKTGLPALLACGLVLFCFTLVVNLGASVIVNRSRTGADA